MIEKILERLDEFRGDLMCDISDMFEDDPDNVKANSILEMFDTAIEIVKQGCVSDDVCEWESASDGEFIQNPHTNRLYSNEPSMRNVYCNTCGKKIKIVGE